MAIENCERCGNLFHKTIKDICSTCVNLEEEAYKKVRMYLKRHKSAELAEVAKETNVELALIIQFLQDGRIALGSGVSTGYPCSQCDTVIFSGALCEPCESKLHDIQRSLHAVTSSVEVVEETKTEPKKGAFHARD